MTAVGIALLLSHSSLAFAELKRGDEAFLQGDYLAAGREWREAANAGDTSAMVALGALYDTGHGVPQDFAQALSWYRRAAEAGNARAMFNVGAMYDKGRGTAVDRPEAIKWYAMSARKGNGRAAYAAATLYRDGNGIPRNPTAAIKFFKMAAAAGIAAARPNLVSLGQAAPLDAAANQFRPTSMATKMTDRTAAVAKHVSSVQSAASDAANVKVEPPLRPAISPTIPGDRVPVTDPSPPPVLEPEVSYARTATGDTASVVEAANVPTSPAKSSGLSAVEVMTPGALAPTMERFHEIALQDADVSEVVAKQYEEIVHEVVRRALKGNTVAQYDIGFAYMHGIGVPSDLIRSAIYYLRASLSLDDELRTVAYRRSIQVMARLTDAQQALASDMFVHDTP